MGTLLLVVVAGTVLVAVTIKTTVHALKAYYKLMAGVAAAAVLVMTLGVHFVVSELADRGTPNDKPSLSRPAPERPRGGSSAGPTVTYDTLPYRQAGR